MFIRWVNVKGKGKSYRYAQLVHAYRRGDGRPTHRVLANLGALSNGQVDILRTAFAAIGQDEAAVVPTAAVPLASLSIQQNLDYLEVAVAYQGWLRSKVGAILDELVPPGDAEMPFAEVVGALTIHRCVAAGSKLAAERWYPQTALPELLGFSPGRFNNTRVHRTLEALDQVTDTLQSRLPDLYLASQPRFAALFLDVTDTWFVGRGAPLAEKAFTKEGLYQYAVGIVLLCNERGYPLRWEVVRARSTDATVMTQMLDKVKGLEWTREVPVVVDRAMGKTATLKTLVDTGLRFVTALTTQEFDAYAAERIPCAAVAGLSAYGPDAEALAANAVEQAGMRRVTDTRYVIDLGVVQRELGDGEAPRSRLHLDESNPAGHALKLAETAKGDVAAGRVRDYGAAARSLKLPTQRMSEYLRLLQLAPDLQEEIKAGTVNVPVRHLVKIAGLPDAEAQRRAYAEQSRKKHAARQQLHMAAGDRPPVKPLRLRAVVCFNPRLFVDVRKRADEVLGRVRTFERDLNARLRSPQSRRSRESVYAEIDQELRRRDLLDAFNIRIEQRDSRVVEVELRLIPDSWQRRRRFDGFSLVVAHPDSPQDAATLTALYRDKDCVEKDFRHIKSEIELRPMWHHTDAKVRAHVTLCMLALMVDRITEHALKESSLPMTARALYEVLRTVHLNRCRVKGVDKSLYMLTDATADQQAVLKALSMAHLVDSQAVTARITPR